MIDVCLRLQVFVELGEVDEVVGDRDQMLNPLLAGLLHDDELVYRILGDETYVGVSIEIAHKSPSVRDFERVDPGSLDF
jgi:hypothetical protein